MTLKKPTDFFSDGETENNTINEDVSNINELIKKPELKSFSESFDVYKSNLEKFQNFSQTIESIESIKKEFQDFLTKEDLDNAMVAYSFLLEESISKVKNDFVEIEIPKKYNKITVESELRALKHYQKFKEELDVLIEDVKQNKIFLDDTFSNFEEKIDNIKEDKIYQLDKIYNVNKLEEENSKLFNKINSLEEKIDDVKNDKTYELDKIYDVGKLEEENYKLSNKIKSIDNTFSNLKEKIDDIKEDKIYQVDKIEEENYKLSKKIKYIEEVFEKFNERNILNESIITEPPNSSNSDPLTPLDKNYVTFKELENHYRLFVNRIQQQLSTFGGGGETQLKYLDDIVGIATNASAFDGKFLKYTHSIGKFEFVTVSGGGGGSPGGSDGQIQYNNGGAFGGATQLFYDDSNNRVGINSATPTEALDVIGSVKATDFNTTSDQNLKNNIKTIENPLSKVLSIRGVNFEWKDSNKASAGVIAQEVEKVLPELVTGQNTKTVNYNGLIGLLIETVKEQQKQIDTLNEKISKLE
jgi:predicted  nucleic acid-binding Zn-ribbon protein